MRASDLCPDGRCALGSNLKMIPSSRPVGNLSSIQIISRLARKAQIEDGAPAKCTTNRENDSAFTLRRTTLHRVEDEISLEY